MSNRADISSAPRWTALLCAGIMAGCSFAGDDPDGDFEPVEPLERAESTVLAEPVGDVELHDGVFEVPDATARNVVVGDDILGVPVDEAGMLAERKAGDIIFAHSEANTFRLQITETRTAGDELQLVGETPELEDVFEHGSFEAVIEPPPTTTPRPAADRPVYDLNEGRYVDPDHDTEADRPSGWQRLAQSEGSAYSWSFGETDLPDNPPDADLQDATLGFHPGIVVRAQVGGDLELELDGDIQLIFDWIAEGNWSGDETFDSTDLFGSSNPSVTIAGATHEMDAQISTEYQLEASGNGQFETRFGVSGPVEVTIDESGDFEYSTQLSASNSTDGDGDLDDATAIVDVEMNFTLDGITGDPLLEVTPVQLNYNNEATIDDASCTWDALASNVVSATHYGPLGDDTDSSHMTVLDQVGTLSGLDDCRPDEPSKTCDDDGDCGPKMGCGDDGTCEVAADMEVELEWGYETWFPGADFVLNVQTQNGVFNHDNPGGDSADAAVVQASCGGGADCNGGDEVIGPFHERIAADASSGDTFKIWVVNEDDVTSEDDITEDNQLSFTVRLNHFGVFESTYSGTIAPNEGISQYILYTVP